MKTNLISDFERDWRPPHGRVPRARGCQYGRAQKEMVKNSTR